jgi:glycosyltransferase involved in cell wall biosynthesis
MTAGLGVIIPAYNEQERIDRCLEAVLRAANHRMLDGVAVRIVAVLDTCTDGTGHRVERAMSRLPKGRDIDLVAVEVAHTNVGMARAAGCATALGLLAGIDIGDAWLATTDADSIVPPNWLAHQVQLHRAGRHAWAGTVEVADWGEHGPEVIHRHSRLYQRDDLPGGHHGHAHGANLGVSAHAYCHCGGFSEVACGEDRALLQALAKAGLPALATSAMPVLTSARRDPRAPGGFGDTLRHLGLGQDEVDVAELVPEVALGQGGGVGALEQLGAGDGLQHGQV